MKYEKLVRDRIPEIIKGKGEIPVTHIAETEEFQRKLREKLDEEIKEFDEKPSVEELADIMEVLEALAKTHDISWEDMLDVKKKKSEERGGFGQKIILDETR